MEVALQIHTEDKVADVAETVYASVRIAALGLICAIILTVSDIYPPITKKYLCKEFVPPTMVPVYMPL